MVDDLLAFAAGGFEGFAQRRVIEGRAGGSDALSAGGVGFFRQQGVFTAGDALGLGGCKNKIKSAHG